LSQCSPDLSCAEVLSVLMPHLAGVVVEGLAEAGDRVLVRARLAAAEVPCPDCGVLSGRRHDVYTRFLRDLPVWGRQAVIRLRVRVLRCVNAGCPRKTFAEQAEGLTSAWARRTPLLREALEAVAAVLAGRAGARLASALGMPAGRHSMLRLVLGLPEEDLAAAPRVLGIDDFAFRRGRTYGTVLIDMETGTIIGVLPDRETDTVKTWLEAHPGAAVICRDRGTGYASACRAGAPDAIQVADRWHLWDNLAGRVRKAVIAALAAHQHDGQQEQRQQEEEREQEEALPRPGPPRPDGGAGTRWLHGQVRRLLEDGCSKAAIARELGLSEPTVRKYAATATAAELLPARQPSAVDPYADYLVSRWNDGARDARALTAEIAARGYKGSDQQVRRFLRPFRALPGGAPAPPPPAPAARDIARWIMTTPGNLTADDAAALTAATSAIPRIAAITGLARSFTDIMTTLTATAIHPATGKQLLDTWLETAETSGIPPLASFARGIRDDHDAVRNGLSLHWSSGMVEGTVCKIKKTKRLLYGRASFPLLRKLLLASSQPA
jgi:transposase